MRSASTSFICLICLAAACGGTEPQVISKDVGGPVEDIHAEVQPVEVAVLPDTAPETTPLPDVAPEIGYPDLEVETDKVLPPDLQETECGSGYDCEPQCEPQPEECNGLDDDCDGDVDEGELVDGDYFGLCDDDNLCTDDTCAGDAGCEHIALDGVECIDGDLCTTGDKCQQGLCMGVALDCDDGNECTDDVCNAEGQCQSTDNSAACDDGDPCTANDECLFGACVGEQLACACQADADCAALEDGDLCNGVLHCDDSTLPYVCQIVPDSEVVCPPPEGPDAECVESVCDPLTGECDIVPIDGEVFCKDGNPCTAGDLCVDGVCVPGAEISCGDGNPCTDDSCDPLLGCVAEYNLEPCDDGDVCTVSDECFEGECTGGPPLDCDDGNPCTDDGCHAEDGCFSADNELPCEGGFCFEGVCVPDSPEECDDDNICTSESLGPDQECVYTLNKLPCDDDNPCTIGDNCHLGTCISGASVDCSDSDVCTDDFCDPVDGCYHVANAAPCNDLNDCTSVDVCVDGHCQGSGQPDCDDDNLCTDDSCDPVLGKCLHSFNDAPCDDGDVCTEADQCIMGICFGAGGGECDDANECTIDECDPDSGCLHLPGPDGVQCDDADICTNEEVCEAGQCVGQAEYDCNDDNICTDDSCDPVDGCLFTPNSLPCPEGMCKNGECLEPCSDCCVAPYLADDFATDKGWDYGPEWERGPATQSGGQQYNNPDPSSDHSTSADNYIAGVVIGGNAGTGLHDFYWVTSPPMDTTGSADLHVAYWRWLNSDYMPYIQNRVQVFNGNSWVTIWETGGSPGIDDTSWKYQDFSVQAHSNSQFRVRFGFMIGSGGVFIVSSWNVDDVTVYDAGPLAPDEPLCCELASGCQGIYADPVDCVEAFCVGP